MLADARSFVLSRARIMGQLCDCWVTSARVAQAVRASMGMDPRRAAVALVVCWLTLARSCCRVLASYGTMWDCLVTSARVAQAVRASMPHAAALLL